MTKEVCAYDCHLRADCLETGTSFGTAEYGTLPLLAVYRLIPAVLRG